MVTKQTNKSATFWHHIQYITHLLFVSINLSLQGVSFSKILQSDKRENGSTKVTRQVETKISWKVYIFSFAYQRLYYLTVYKTIKMIASITINNVYYCFKIRFKQSLYKSHCNWMWFWFLGILTWAWLKLQSVSFFLSHLLAFHTQTHWDVASLRDIAQIHN